MHNPPTMHAPHNHACPQPCMPPTTTHASPDNHTCPPQQPHMPPATTHAPQQPCMSPGNHSCPHGQNSWHTLLKDYLAPTSLRALNIRFCLCVCLFVRPSVTLCADWLLGVWHAIWSSWLCRQPSRDTPTPLHPRCVRGLIYNRREKNFNSRIQKSQKYRFILILPYPEIGDANFKCALCNREITTFSVLSHRKTHEKRQLRVVFYVTTIEVVSLF